MVASNRQAGFPEGHRFRIEKDSLGEVSVPEDALYGPQTARSLENFPIGDDLFSLEVIHSLVLIKKAAAMVNERLGVLTSEKSTTIIAACDEILTGKYNDQFPLSVWQTGSGTQSNMNVNEVIARIARQSSSVSIHPNDDVNRSQSSNDTVPTAIHLAAVRMVHDRLFPALAALRGSLHTKSKEFASITKTGRTHLQDATPVRLGQEFGSYADMMIAAERRIRNATEEIQYLAIGGTATGTGLNAPEGFRAGMVAELSRIAGHPFYTAPNLMEALSSHASIVFFHGAIKSLATDLMKIANDIRWMGSGPRNGLGELTLPANEPGSSIMPGKVNPTQAEALTQVAVQVMANDQAISTAASQGNLELNVFKPLIAKNVIHSLKIIADAMKSFALRCVDGIQANEGHIASQLERSLMLVTVLTPEIGYDRAGEIAKKAYAENTSLKEAALALGHISEERFDELVRPEQMT